MTKTSECTECKFWYILKNEIKYTQNYYNSKRMETKELIKQKIIESVGDKYTEFCNSVATFYDEWVVEEIFNGFNRYFIVVFHNKASNSKFENCMESASSSDSEDCATGIFVDYGEHSVLELNGKGRSVKVENLNVYVMYNELYLMDCFILPDEFDIMKVKRAIFEYPDYNQNVFWFENTEDKTLFKLSDFLL